MNKPHFLGAAAIAAVLLSAPISAAEFPQPRFDTPNATTPGSLITLASSVESDGFNLLRVGRSLGGNLRTGPGMQYDTVRGVAEGTWLTIRANSGVRFDGYDWFEVVLDDGTRGFQWGGIMCANGEPLAGTYSVCGQEPVTGPSAAGWLSFAVGSDGTWGHGAGATRSDAERLAQSNCPGWNCEIVATTNSRCQALALAPGQNWVGDGDTAAQAGNNAMNFCTRNASQCRLEYSYCQ